MPDVIRLEYEAYVPMATEVLAAIAREIEIVRLVRRGLANRQIAETLGVAEGTVKVHLHNIYEKLSVQRRGELIAFADEYGLS